MASTTSARPGTTGSQASSRRAVLIRATCLVIAVGLAAIIVWLLTSSLRAQFASQPTRTFTDDVRTIALDALPTPVVIPWGMSGNVM